MQQFIFSNMLFCEFNEQQCIVDVFLLLPFYNGQGAISSYRLRLVGKHCKNQKQTSVLNTTLGQQFQVGIVLNMMKHMEQVTYVIEIDGKHVEQFCILKWFL